MDPQSLEPQEAGTLKLAPFWWVTSYVAQTRGGVGPDCRVPGARNVWQLWRDGMRPW